jgi:mercuric ion transport protein
MSETPATSTLPALIVAALTAMAASVCCIVPLALVLAGVSGAWIANLTALETWRPWFSGVTVICLALAFWSLYGPTSRCRTDGECRDLRVLRHHRLGLWIATALIAMVLLFPYYAGWIL